VVGVTTLGCGMLVMMANTKPTTKSTATNKARSPTKAQTPSGSGVIDPGRTGSRSTPARNGNGTNGTSRNSPVRNGINGTARNSPANNNTQSARSSASNKSAAATVAPKEWWQKVKDRDDDPVRIASSLHKLAHAIYPGPDVDSPRRGGRQIPPEKTNPNTKTKDRGR
jgi:hypothetical protein